MATQIDYNEFVVVSEMGMMMYTEHDMNESWYHLDNIKLGYTLKNHLNQHLISLECEEVTKGWVAEIHVEVLVHGQERGQTSYKQLTPNTQRHLFCEGQTRWEYSAPSCCQKILLTVRLLKKRSEFPTFVEPEPGNNRKSYLYFLTKLKIGSRLFYVSLKPFTLEIENSFVSTYLINKELVESKAEEIELIAGEFADPDIFLQDFMLTCLLSKWGRFGNVLPNRQNIAALLKMAKICQAEILRQKCKSHLQYCREMPLKERIFLCMEYDLKDVRIRFVQKMSDQERKQLMNEILDE